MSPIDPEMPLAVESFVKHFGENAENPPHNIRDITALGGFDFDMHMVVHYAILSVPKAVTLFDTLEDFFEHQLDFISFQNVLLEVCPGCYVIVCSRNFWLNFSHTYINQKIFRFYSKLRKKNKKRVRGGGEGEVL